MLTTEEVIDEDEDVEDEVVAELVVLEEVDEGLA